MTRTWAIAALALWVVMAIAMNYAIATAAPTLPMDQLANAFV